MDISRWHVRWRCLGPLLAGWFNLNYRPRKHWIIWLIPTRVCIPVVLFMTLTHVAYKFLRKSNFIDPSALSGIYITEITELYIAVFFAYYTASMYKRLSQAPNMADRDIIIGP